jgi:hypothetical protein
LPAAAPIIALAVAMVEPSFGAALMAVVGAPPLADAGMLAAWGAAVALSAIAVRADEEYGVTLVTETNSLPEYRFAMNCRHASSQAGLDNGTGFVSGWNQLSLVYLSKGCRTRNPAALTAGFHHLSPSMTRVLRSGERFDDRTDDCAFGAMMLLSPAKVQKTTFSDD